MPNKKQSKYYSEEKDFEKRKIEIINPIIQEIENKKQDLQNNKLFISIDKEKLLEAISNMSIISNELGGKIKFIENYDKQTEEISISDDFRFEKKFILDNKEVNEMIEITENCNLILLTPTFKEDCKWEFEDGGDKITCDMLDLEFFSEVIARKKIIKANDVYVVKKQTIKRFDNGKWKKQYSILKVGKIIESTDLFNQ